MYVYIFFFLVLCLMNYSNNLFFGCYIILRESNLIFYNYVKECCFDDGGVFFLLNLKEEIDEVIKLMSMFYFFNFFDLLVRK